MDMFNTDLIQVFILATLTAGLLIATLFYLRSRKSEHYNQELQRAQLEQFRASLESRMYELNSRLLATEGRWRDVNHLILSAINKMSEVEKPPKQVHTTSFLASFGLTESDLRIDPKLVFVLTPFHHDHDATFEAIAEVVRQAGLRCLRGDEELVPGDLLTHILRLLGSARLVIANIEGRNPNVFYELGLAHALDKTTIIVSRTAKDLPFDVRTRKLILYKDVSELQVYLQRELTRALIAETSKTDAS